MSTGISFGYLDASRFRGHHDDWTGGVLTLRRFPGASALEVRCQRDKSAFLNGSMFGQMRIKEPGSNLIDVTRFWQIRIE